MEYWDTNLIIQSLPLNNINAFENLYFSISLFNSHAIFNNNYFYYKTNNYEIFSFILYFWDFTRSYIFNWIIFCNNYNSWIISFNINFSNLININIFNEFRCIDLDWFQDFIFDFSNDLERIILEKRQDWFDYYTKGDTSLKNEPLKYLKLIYMDFYDVSDIDFYKFYIASLVVGESIVPKLLNYNHIEYMDNNNLFLLYQPLYNFISNDSFLYNPLQSYILYEKNISDIKLNYTYDKWYAFNKLATGYEDDDFFLGPKIYN